MTILTADDDITSDDNTTTITNAFQDLEVNNRNLSPKEQKERIWKHLVSQNGQQKQKQDKREWPSYDAVLRHMKDANYEETLTCPMDILKDDGSSGSCPKTFCPYGVVCCAKMELFPFVADNPAAAPYTGLLTPDTTIDHMMIRLSSAISPPSKEIKSKVVQTLMIATGDKLRKSLLFPCAAIKVFRGKDDYVINGGDSSKATNTSSGNLLFGGSKVGQREGDFFAHCVCTSMTEQMPRLVKPVVKKFWEYSDYPMSLGCSEFCQYDKHGVEEKANMNFPFAVILSPRPELQQSAASAAGAVDSFDRFLDTALHIKAGTVLYDVFTCPDPLSVPDASKLQRIGQITSTTEFIQSFPNDGLFFRHQAKEQDYALRPHWPYALNTAVTIDYQGAVTKGTVGKLAGWKVFEQHIKVDGGYVDFEKAANEEKH